MTSLLQITMSTSKRVREQCPRCLDSSQDNLVHAKDGQSAHCYACGYHVVFGSHKQTKSKFKVPKIDLAESLKIPGKPWISPEILAKYNVFDLLEGSKWGFELTQTKVYYWYNNQGHVVGVKYRNFDRELKSKSIWCEEGSQFGFFGRLTGQRCIFICEGESDTLTLAEVLKDESGVDIVGVNGTDSVREVLKSHIKELRSYEYIYICFDNDEAGKKAETTAEELLPVYKTYYLDLPCKDISECYEEGYDLREILDNARIKSSPYLITDDELVDEFCKRMSYQSMIGTDVGYESLNSMLGGGIKPGEVMGLFGHSGTGKSTFAVNILYNVIASPKNKGKKALWVGTEMYASDSMRFLLERHLNTPIFPEGDGLNISQDVIDREIKRLSEKVVYFSGMADNFSIVEQAIHSALFEYDISLLVIDVINDLDTKMQNVDDSRSVMRRIISIANGNYEERRPPVPIILVGHTIKNVDGQYSSRITNSDIRNPSIFQMITAGVAFNGKVNSTQRHCELIKKSRMSVSRCTEFNLEYDVQQSQYFEVTL